MHDRRAKYCYDYPRPALTADVVVLRVEGEGAQRRQEVLLIQRGHPPFVGHWALPGGFVDPGESPGEAARRELYEETGLSARDFAQIGVFGNPDRDPRGWVVSVAYAATLVEACNDAIAGDDAARLRWWPVGGLPPLAFDHREIVEVALGASRRK